MACAHPGSDAAAVLRVPSLPGMAAAAARPSVRSPSDPCSAPSPLLMSTVKSIFILATCMGLSFAIMILSCAFYENWLATTMRA